MVRMMDDRWLWFYLGATIFIAVKGIAYGLNDTLRLTEYDEPHDNATTTEQSAEDSISLDALRTLAASCNTEMSHATIALLVSRFAASASACTQLTSDLFSSSKDVRNRAKYVLDLFDDYPISPSFSKSRILRVDYVQSLRDTESDETMQAMCTAFFRAFSRMNHGMSGYRHVAEAIENAMLGYGPTESMAGMSGHDLVDSLDLMLARAGSPTPPVRVPTAALSAILQSGVGRRSSSHTTTSRQLPEESPEEAEVRRRRNRAARVMEVAEEYVIV